MPTNRALSSRKSTPMASLSAAVASRLRPGLLPLANSLAVLRPGQLRQQATGALRLSMGKCATMYQPPAGWNRLR